MKRILLHDTVAQQRVNLHAMSRLNGTPRIVLVLQGIRSPLRLRRQHQQGAPRRAACAAIRDSVPDTRPIGPGPYHAEDTVRLPATFSGHVVTAAGHRSVAGH